MSTRIKLFNSTKEVHMTVLISVPILAFFRDTDVRINKDDLNKVIESIVDYHNSEEFVRNSNFSWTVVGNKK